VEVIYAQSFDFPCSAAGFLFFCRNILEATLLLFFCKNSLRLLHITAVALEAVAEGCSGA